MKLASFQVQTPVGRITRIGGVQPDNSIVDLSSAYAALRSRVGNSSGVVLSTVRRAADADYELVVLADCCADGDEEAHRVLTQKVFPRQATVVASQNFIRALGGA